MSKFCRPSPYIEWTGLPLLSMRCGDRAEPWWRTCELLTTGCMFSVVIIWFRCLSNSRVGEEECALWALLRKDGFRAPEFIRSVRIWEPACDNKCGGISWELAA